MTVMNNTFIETTPNFSEVEIGAARNAFFEIRSRAATSFAHYHANR